MTTQLFQSSQIKDCREVFPTIIVTIVNHWTGNAPQKRAYMNYLVLGLNYDQQQAYNMIIRDTPGTLKAAEQYAQANADVINHY